MKEHGATGKVYLVGGGPGDPRLITLRAVECLRRADLVLYDYLVDPQVVEHAPPAAERVRLERHGQSQETSAAAVIARMIEAARDAKTVVRLKGGDPAVFGHLAEELAALRAAAIPVEIVPGVTAACAAAASAQIPLTHGCRSSAVALVAGHERGDKTASRLDYAALARFSGTLVFYMGVGTAAHWSEELIREGKPADTPVAIVRRCSWPDQTALYCTLATVAATIARHQVRPPAVILVGEIAAGDAPGTKETR